MKTKTARLLYIDGMNVLACLAVVFLHCNGLVHKFTPTPQWAQALAAEVLFYWAVPVFLMISGTTLMNYRAKYDTVTFFKKRLIRTLIPFLLWSVLMAFEQNMDVGSWGIRTWYNNIFGAKIESVYWFFPQLFCAYLSIPVLSHLTQPQHRNTLWYLVIVSFVTRSTLPFLANWLEIKWNIGLPVAGGYVIYLVLGYLLSTQTWTRKQRLIIYAMGILAAVFRYIYTYQMSYLAGTTDTSIKDYTSFHAVMLSVAVYVFLKDTVPWNKIFSSDKAQKLLLTMSSCSLGIYLIHKFLMRRIIMAFDISVSIWWWRLLAPFGVYALALLLVWSIKKIPVLRQIFP